MKSVKTLNSKLLGWSLVTLLSVEIVGCANDSKPAETEVSKQAKAMEDKAVNKINQANADTAKKMEEADK
ncbi:hypothetical protein ACGTJS_03055 [Faucicola mancuniensis]|uniref:hypothetical protein n=1 Tax=Faucicola mancuniensis TaxID=1309795 RepID=UPI0039775048